MSERAQSDEISAEADEEGRWWTLPLVIVALAVIAFGLVRDFQHRDRIEAQQQRISRMRENLERTEARFQVVATTLGEREADVRRLQQSLAAMDRALSVVRDPGVRLAHLGGTPDALLASAHVLVGSGEGRALVYAFDLPPLDAARTYQLWWITENSGPVQAGLFNSKVGVPTRLEAALPPDLGVLSAASVTVEPVGGVPKPTGPTVLSGSLASPSH